MKYCSPYFKNYKYMAEIDEIIVPYAREDLTFIENVLKNEKLLNGVVIVEVLDMNDFYQYKCLNIFKALKKSGNLDFKLKFEKYNKTMEDMFEELKKEEIPFFFQTHATSLDIFHGLMELGVSDIYIVEELGFSLSKLGQIASAKGISIRVYADICQSSWEGADPLKSFFIRPEDVPAYEPYVDVIEFYTKDFSRAEVLYRAYAQDKKWFGDLKYLITGLDVEVDSRRILPIFGEIRTKCEKRCMKGGDCSICSRIVDVSKILEEKNFILKK